MHKLSLVYRPIVRSSIRRCLSDEAFKLGSATTGGKVDHSKAKVKIKTGHEHSATPPKTEIPVSSTRVERVDVQQKAMFATKIGAFVNVSMAVSKGIIGFTISSTALIADAVNSMGDVLGDAVVYYTVKEARKRATPDRPWGRGKLEPLGALSVGGLLALTGLGIGYSALLTVIDMANLSSLVPLQFLDIFPATGDAASSAEMLRPR
jgi:Co/Zn/Cd efflux system component